MKILLVSLLALQFMYVALGSTNISYDNVGKTYDATRCADPVVTHDLIAYMQPSPGKKYLDVSCGSGNYTVALYQAGLDICGIDISQEMLKKAEAKQASINWIHGDAQSLPFADNVFDGVYCIHAIHHYKDLEIAFKEMYRVLAPGGTLIVFTTVMEQCEWQWIGHYFPLVLESGRKFVKTQSTLVGLLENAGFDSVRCEKYFVTKDTKDLTIYGGKYRPEVYLDPIVRAGMTPLNMPAYAEQIEAGVRALEADINSGEINTVIARYESDFGEHTYMIATK